MKNAKYIRVLVACEESQRVCIEFRKRGFTAFSCDIQPCSGGHPEWHIQGDVIPVINGDCKFTTEDGTFYSIKGKWDLIIAHPPCTYFALSGNGWFNIERWGDKAIERYKEREKALEFFLKIANADCEHIAIENPKGTISQLYRMYDQCIQPYEHGHPERKSTCLWLKNLPKIKPTNIVEPKLTTLPDGKQYSDWHLRTFGMKPEERRRERSKTFEGIAKAFAEQWGDYLLNETDKER